MVEGSRKEVVRFMRSVVAEFQIPDERTPTAKRQDWAVNLAWGGSEALASSGMIAEQPLPASSLTRNSRNS